MTSRQRVRRLLLWRSFGGALLFFITYVGALGLADYITSEQQPHPLPQEKRPT